MHPQKISGKYISYICSTGNQKFIHPGLCISENKIESALLAKLQTLADEYNINIECQTLPEEERSKEIESLNARLKRIGIRYEDGDISVEEYRAKRDEIKTKIAALEVTPSKKKKVVLPDGFDKTYTQLDRDKKQRFWRSLIVSITIDPKRKCDFRVDDIFWR